MDFIGGIIFAGSVTTLIIALQWGGNQKPWNDAGVITVSFFPEERDSS